MVREFSAGGVVFRNRNATVWIAAIQLPLKPGAEPPVNSSPPLRPKPILALPKGLIDSGETPLQAALREVFEETGITAAPVNKLGDIKYVYARTWAGGERVFKVVSFYLLRYCSGRINRISEDMRIEVARALWIELERAPELLAYKGEKEMARKALQFLREHATA